MFRRTHADRKALRLAQMLSELDARAAGRAKAPPPSTATRISLARV